MSIGSLGTAELLVVLVIFVLLFGSTRIPALASAIGGTIRQFRKGISEPELREPQEDRSTRDS